MHQPVVEFAGVWNNIRVTGWVITYMMQK